MTGVWSGRPANQSAEFSGVVIEAGAVKESVTRPQAQMDICRRRGSDGRQADGCRAAPVRSRCARCGTPAPRRTRAGPGGNPSCGVPDGERAGSPLSTATVAVCVRQPEASWARISQRPPGGRLPRVRRGVGRTRAPARSRRRAFARPAHPRRRSPGSRHSGARVTPRRRLASDRPSPRLGAWDHVRPRGHRAAGRRSHALSRRVEFHVLRRRCVPRMAQPHARRHAQGDGALPGGGGRRPSGRAGTLIDDLACIRDVDVGVDGLV